jgi:hypothetical protein
MTHDTLQILLDCCRRRVLPKSTLACLCVGVAPTQLTNFCALSRHSPEERNSDLRGVFYKLLRPELVFAYKQKHNIYLCSDAFTAWVCQ